MTSSLPSDPPASELPFLRRTASGAQLVIGGRPRLLLGGQLHNSSASSAEHMRPVWQRLAEQGIGTVIGSASWAQVEPVEGTFDFSSVDAQIAAATEHELHLVLIWFGAFKNAASTYAPTWVRQDVDRFPRAVVRGRQEAGLHLPGRHAQARAQRVLAGAAGRRPARVRRADGAPGDRGPRPPGGHGAGGERDRHPAGQPRPVRRRRGRLGLAGAIGRCIDRLVQHEDELRPELAALWARQGRRTSGTWAEVLGDDWEAEEAFMAWGFASYVGALAAAGKAVMPLPMYAERLARAAARPTAGRRLPEWRAGRAGAWTCGRPPPRRWT